MSMQFVKIRLQLKQETMCFKDVFTEGWEVSGKKVENNTHAYTLKG